ncbi:myosin heavy chain-like protein [Wolffia australiana]
METKVPRSRLGFKVRRLIFNGGRGGWPSTPVRPWKVEAELESERNPSRERSKLEVDEERRRRRRSERIQRDLAREAADAKSAHSVLADLCDELAAGIRDYEEAAREPTRPRRRSPRVRRLVLHVSDAWLDARSQMNLAESRGDLAGRRIVERRLAGEIEEFLRSVRSNCDEEEEDDDGGLGIRSRNLDRERKSDATWRSIRSVEELENRDRRRREFEIDGGDRRSSAAAEWQGRRRSVAGGEKISTLEAKLLEARMEPSRISYSGGYVLSPLTEQSPAKRVLS